MNRQKIQPETSEFLLTNSVKTQTKVQETLEFKLKMKETLSHSVYLYN